MCDIHKYMEIPIAGKRRMIFQREGSIMRQKVLQEV